LSHSAVPNGHTQQLHCFNSTVLWQFFVVAGTVLWQFFVVAGTVLWRCRCVIVLLCDDTV
jgi:hypothetical protein